MSCNRRHTFGIITAKLSPWSSPGHYWEQDPRGRTASFHPKPTGTSSQTLHDFRRIWKRRRRRSVTFCRGKTKAEAQLMPCAGRASVLPHTALQHHHRPTPNLSCPQEGVEEGKGRREGDLGTQSPGSDAPSPLPSVNREGSARAASLGNEAQLAAAPSAADRAVPSPQPPGDGGLYL